MCCFLFYIKILSQYETIIEKIFSLFLLLKQGQFPAFDAVVERTPTHFFLKLQTFTKNKEKFAGIVLHSDSALFHIMNGRHTKL